MPQLVSARLAAQLQRRTIDHAYTDAGFYIPAPDVATLDDYGQPTASTSLVPVSCSFTDKPSAEKWQGYADIAEIVAEVRWATPQPNKGAQFKISKRFGNFANEQTYEIVGVQDRGAFGYVCALKAVTI